MRITDFPELIAPTGNDLLVTVDIANDLTKKVKLDNLPISLPALTALATKQDSLVSGVTIKTVNSQSLLGAGDIPIPIVNPSGVSGAIQFSNGSAFASDATNLFWDDTNNRLGVGTNTPTSRLQVKGDGTNPVARFENSAGTQGFVVKSNGLVFEPISANGAEQIMAGYSGGFVLSGSVLAINVNTFESQSNVTASLASTYGGGWRMLHSNYAMTSGNLKTFQVSGGIASATGSANYRPIQVDYTINNSGAQTGTATGIFLNSTETALNGMTNRLMDLQNGGVSMLRVERLGQLSSIGYSIDAARFRFNNQNYNTNFGYIQGNSNGVFSLIDNTEANFNRLQFGGTTSAFPSIKRNGTAIDFRLADDSGFCNINIAGITSIGDVLLQTSNTSKFISVTNGTNKNIYQNYNAHEFNLAFGSPLAYSTALSIVGNAALLPTINIFGKIVAASLPTTRPSTVGEFYVDTAANILANGDKVVGIRV
jgi:hypothetical protein